MTQKQKNDSHDANDHHGVGTPTPAPDSPLGSDVAPAPIKASSVDATEGKESADDAFSEEERRERDRLTKKGRAKLKRGYRADIEFGQILRELRDKRLHREGGMTLEEFSIEEFDITDDSVRAYINFADLHAAFKQAGVEPLQVKSQATALLPLPTLDDQVRAARRGRELAEAEGSRLAARHIMEARAEIESELLGETETSEDPLAEAKEAVRTRGGIHIVLPKDSPAVAGHNEAKRYGPEKVIVPFDPDASESELMQPPCASRKGPPSLERTDVDEIAEYVYSALTSDAWKPAKAWALGDESFRATYQPAWLTAPSEHSDSEDGDDRGSTALLTPGVDLYHPDVPDIVRQAVLSSVKADPATRYLALTHHADRVESSELAPNIFICVEANDRASAEACSKHVAELQTTGSARCVLVLRDCTEALPLTVFEPFEWVLLRGERTSQAAYDSVFAAQSKGLIPPDGVQVGRTVRVRHQGYRPVTDGDLTSTEKQKRKDRRPTKIKTRPGSREGTPTV